MVDGIIVWGENFLLVGMRGCCLYFGIMFVNVLFCDLIYKFR